MNKKKVKNNLIQKNKEVGDHIKKKKTKNYISGNFRDEP